MSDQNKLTYIQFLEKSIEIQNGKIYENNLKTNVDIKSINILCEDFFAETSLANAEKTIEVFRNLFTKNLSLCQTKSNIRKFLCIISPECYVIALKFDNFANEKKITADILAKEFCIYFVKFLQLAATSKQGKNIISKYAEFKHTEMLRDKRERDDKWLRDNDAYLDLVKFAVKLMIVSEHKDKIEQNIPKLLTQQNSKPTRHLVIFYVGKEVVRTWVIYL